jgi:hypothetical protein
MALGDWKNNTIMTWNGTKVTDHGRGPLGVSVERLGIDKRMADGTLRRQFIKNKRAWSMGWENIPSRNNVSGGISTADGGMSGTEIEEFFNATPGKFRLVLKRGSAIGKTVPNPAETALPYEDSDFYICNVMFTEFSKEVRKRGIVDLWGINVTLEEV